MPEAVPVTDPTIPQVLLFGHLGSGKSSLLAALMRAGEIQGEALHGEVQEASGRLAEIRDAVCRGTALTRTESELMSYLVRVRPWRRGGEARSFILHDCFPTAFNYIEAETDGGEMMQFDISLDINRIEPQ